MGTTTEIIKTFCSDYLGTIHLNKPKPKCEKKPRNERNLHLSLLSRRVVAVLSQFGFGRELSSVGRLIQHIGHPPHLPKTPCTMIHSHLWGGPGKVTQRWVYLNLVFKKIYRTGTVWEEKKANQEGNGLSYQTFLSLWLQYSNARPAALCFLEDRNGSQLHLFPRSKLMFLIGSASYLLCLMSFKEFKTRLRHMLLSS